MLKNHSPAPTFSLPDQNGTTHKLDEYKEKWVLLYFYPKDDTPGCTIEAKGFRDTIDEFKALNCVVFGVSKDTVQSHTAFAEKCELPFSLLADPDREMISAYGAWRENQFMGKPGVHRCSVLIDPEGNIAKVYEKVQPEEHPKEVLSDLKQFQ